ncbi:hypothetical protein GQ602_002992 [Ophiocordyceps camponoti-floridani]|uniref:Uncharacterized protein n=1 Tax=Ophiocordyceps camponoti-floridani TaxID=2030778 RepID=A0A8H4Q7E8_9HYPO|nr:hypothetical protein GQ602_002992 [Ophiocordyceps camponoti-floridani]
MKLTVEGLLAVLAASSSFLGAANAYPHESTSVAADVEASPKPIQHMEKRQQAKTFNGCKMLFSLIPWNKGLDERSLDVVFDQDRTLQTQEMSKLQGEMKKAAAKNDQAEVKKLLGVYCNKKTEAWNKLTPEQREAEKKADIQRLKKQESEDRAAERAAKTGKGRGKKP